jgi:hypothetical protein
MLTVRRWTRYGKDRLYVSAEDGQRVGWLDLVTGVEVLEQPGLAEEFQHAISSTQAAGLGNHEAEQRVGAAAVLCDVQIAVPPALEPAPESWTDLALNRPGQGVRAEAEALLAGMTAQSRVGTFLKRALDVKTPERAFRVGAAGEEAVGPRLERLLKHGWKVLHSIPVGKGKSDIDHLLIGPAGIYTINTKNHPGGRVWVGEHSIRVNGQPTDYLRNSRYEAERVRKALHRQLAGEVRIRAALVFLTGTVVPQVTIKQMPDVLVLDRMDIPGIFKRSSGGLGPETVDDIYQVARRSSTWR